MTDEEFYRRIEQAIHRTVDRIGREFVVPGIQASISTPYPPSSSPGMPPHRRTGSLHDNISSAAHIEQDGASVVISSSRPGGPAQVPLWLEVTGSGNMAPRPYMVPQMMELRSTLLPVAARMFIEEF